MIKLRQPSVAAALECFDASALQNPRGRTPESASFVPVRSLGVFEDGSGPAMYVGGAIISAGGVSLYNIARLSGAAWSPLGDGTTCARPASSMVFAMAVYDDGTDGGPALYGGGSFTEAGGLPAERNDVW